MLIFLYIHILFLVLFYSNIKPLIVKRFLTLYVFSLLLSSCITVKVYKMDQNSKEEPKKPIQKKSALLSSEIIVPLMNGDSEIYFFGEEPEIIDFDKKESSPHINKNVFVFKSKDSLGSLDWISNEGDSLSGKMIFINQNKGNIKGEYIFEESRPVIILDGEEMDLEFDLEKLNADDIERIEIFKGQKALQKVGEKGKNGVIIIKMKN